MKSAKIIIRDCGVAHALLGIADRDALLAYSLAGSSWEPFVVEDFFWSAPNSYRTSAGAEIALVLAFPSGALWAIAAKFELAPTVEKRFHSACEILQPGTSPRGLSGNRRVHTHP